MPKYEYTAISVNGGMRKFKGVVDAPSGELAIMNLIQRRLYPVSLREMSQMDITVASRIANFRKIKNAFVGPRPVPGPVIRTRFRIPWGILGWGIAILALLWAITRI